MDKALPKLLAFPPQPPPVTGLDEVEYDQQIRDVVKQLGTIPAKQFLQQVDGKLLLDSLDPFVHPLPYLYALAAQINAEKSKDSEVFTPSASTWAHIERFTSRFDPVQVRYVGFQWRTLLEELVALADASDDEAEALKALNLVQDAMLRLDPETSTFTSTHLALVKSCLAKRIYEPCMKVLANDIYHFPVRSEANRHIQRPSAKHLSSSTYITTASGFSKELTYRDHLQYFLFAAMISIAHRDWSRALFLLEMTLTAPVNGNTVSMIQVEAYKKYLLVFVLQHDRAASSLRTLSPQTNKLLTSLAKPYHALSEAYKERAPARLQAEYKAGFDDQIWASDRNQQLVQLVVASHRRTQILSFSKVYTSIPFTTLARLISEQQESRPENPAAVEKEIRDIVAAKLIHASVATGDDGTVVLKFLSADGRAPLTDVEQVGRLSGFVTKIQTLNEHVLDSQKRLELTKDYVLAVKRRRVKEESMRQMDSDDPGAQFRVEGVEEDMLADL